MVRAAAPAGNSVLTTSPSVAPIIAASLRRPVAATPPHPRNPGPRKGREAARPQGRAVRTGPRTSRIGAPGSECWQLRSSIRFYRDTAEQMALARRRLNQSKAPAPNAGRAADVASGVGGMVWPYWRQVSGCAGRPPPASQRHSGIRRRGAPAAIIATSRRAAAEQMPPIYTGEAARCNPSQPARAHPLDKPRARHHRRATNRRAQPNALRFPTVTTTTVKMGAKQVRSAVRGLRAGWLG